ncbi:MAG: hypothetical protein UT35_C0003G0017 [Candidatus Yanofskybacteria bacterium GW2011_GWD1_39_16]|uniref:Uncharacterized protein n=1 Tax=Candidatus Yanofskybacteria bacterium GW2011_GWD1_39_16 TaxID=1619030 RepID=A0A837HTB5_9BACT|nr:MAG: hypothetical protein UT35_C0003G0017 [Candidatus Yanofskybacteria bacterium GW2011_GWD1_39_16]
MDQYDQQARPEKVSVPNIQTNSNLIAILAYLSILVFIPYFISSNNSFVRFHVSQGITLFVFEILLYVISAIFGFMMSGLLYMFIDLLQLFLLVLAIIGVINVVKNRTNPLPIIGHINILPL